MKESCFLLTLKTNSLYVMEAVKFISELTENSVDLFVLDPPYNMKKADWDTFKSKNDFVEFCKTWIHASFPKLREGGSIYIFNTPENCAYLLPILQSTGLTLQNWLTWDKRDGMGYSRKKFAAGQETILFLTKGKGHTFNADEIRVPYESTDRIAAAAKKGILKNGKRWFPNSEGRLCGEVWHFPSHRHVEKISGKTQKFIHATIKPLPMIERIILASSNPGDLVVDFFMGTGTTAVAAKSLGRNFLGCDLSSEYINYARGRLKDVKS